MNCCGPSFSCLKIENVNIMWSFVCYSIRPFPYPMQNKSATQFSMLFLFPTHPLYIQYTELYTAQVFHHPVSQSVLPLSLSLSIFSATFFFSFFLSIQKPKSVQVSTPKSKPKYYLGWHQTIIRSKKQGTVAVNEGWGSTYCSRQ